MTHQNNPLNNLIRFYAEFKHQSLGGSPWYHHLDLDVEAVTNDSLRAEVMTILDKMILKPRTLGGGNHQAGTLQCSIKIRWVNPAPAGTSMVKGFRSPSRELGYTEERPIEFKSALIKMKARGDDDYLLVEWTGEIEKKAKSEEEDIGEENITVGMIL